MKRSRWFGVGGLIIAWFCWSLSMPPALAETGAAEPVQSLFTAQCAGCHVNGGNIVRRRKTLKQRALERNGVDSVEAIATLITNGKGAMSAYGDRLSAAEIDLLAHYVWDRAQDDWQ